VQKQNYDLTNITYSQWSETWLEYKEMADATSIEARRGNTKGLYVKIARRHGSFKHLGTNSASGNAEQPLHLPAAVLYHYGYRN